MKRGHGCDPNKTLQSGRMTSIAFTSFPDFAFAVVLLRLRGEARHRHIGVLVPRVDRLQLSVAALAIEHRRHIERALGTDVEEMKIPHRELDDNFRWTERADRTRRAVVDVYLIEAHRQRRRFDFGTGFAIVPGPRRVHREGALEALDIRKPALRRILREGIR